MAHAAPHPSYRANQLLAALPPDTIDPLLAKMVRVSLPARQLLYTAGETIDAVYFPETGMVSMVKRLEEGAESEVGIVGREGMVGLPLVHGIDTGFADIMVHLPTTALRMNATVFMRELESVPAVKALILRYAEMQAAQIAQTAVCNCHHGLEERLARWLLMAHDRAETDELPMTQDLLAMMLGVHRPSITVTAGILQRAGLIRYRAGRITIIDRSRLEAASCACYSSVQQRIKYVLAMPVTSPPIGPAPR